jgi:hypothetical protein
MSNLVPVDQIQTMANAVAKSGLFGVKTPEQAMALMLIAQAEGNHPAIAARDYHVIQGRPALKADAMLARFQQAGGKVNWDTYTDTEVKATFSHPSGGSITLSWTIDQARKIGIAGKDNWKNYPRAMLRARVISEGIRTVYPGCVVGVYTPEEVQDFDTKPRVEKDVTPVAPVDPMADLKSDIINVDPKSGEITITPPAEEPWELFIPGKQSIVVPDKGNWIIQLMTLVDRVARSKMNTESKNEKIKALKDANLKQFQRMGLIESVEISKQIAMKISIGDDSEKKEELNG